MVTGFLTLGILVLNLDIICIPFMAPLHPLILLTLFSYIFSQSLLEINPSYSANHQIQQKLKWLFGISTLTKLLEATTFMQFFTKKNWDLSKNQIINAIINIFSTWDLPSNWCETLLCLIPKSNNPTTVHHFCPLGLYTTHYKILSKILVNRLRPHLQRLIPHTQGSFIKGRHTGDLFLLAHETLHSMNRSKKQTGLDY